MSIHTPEYPHVSAVSDIAPINGDGPEAAYVVAMTKLGETLAEVAVYWSNDEDGTPRLIVGVDGAGSEYVRVTVNDGIVFEGKPEPQPVRLDSLAPDTLFTFAGKNVLWKYIGPTPDGHGARARMHNPHDDQTMIVEFTGHNMVHPA